GDYVKKYGNDPEKSFTDNLFDFGILGLPFLAEVLSDGAKNKFANCNCNQELDNINSIRKKRAKIGHKTGTGALSHSFTIDFMNWQSKRVYPNQGDFFQNSDMVVSTASQSAGKIRYGSNNGLTILEEVNHSFGKDKVVASPLAGDKVFELLNTSVHNTTDFSKTMAASPAIPKTYNCADDCPTSPKAPNGRITEAYRSEDTEQTPKIEILNPINGAVLQAFSPVDINIILHDTVNLYFVETKFQGFRNLNTLSDNSLNYKLQVNSDVLGWQRIISEATYKLSDNTFTTYADTVWVNVKTSIPVVNIEANKLLYEMQVGDKENLDITVYHESFDRQLLFIDDSLTISIENLNIVNYDTLSGQFVALQAGNTKATIDYKGKTTEVFFNIYSQSEEITITTGSWSTPSGDSTVCTEATISVPFTTSGGAFNEGNQFIIQLSDASGENFTSLETTGTSSPLAAKIPNGLPNADTYQVRVLSLSPPVIGTVATQPLKIRSCETQSNFKISGNSVICEGESVTLTASGCEGALHWSTGSTASSITVTPFTTSSYIAYCAKPSGDSSTARFGIAVLPKTRLDTATITSATCFPVLTASNLSYGLRPVWRKDGLIIQGMESETYTPIGAGSYTVEPEELAGSWVPQWGNLTAAHLADVAFPSASVGFAVGEEGILLKSMDAGANWESLQSGTTSDLKRIHMISSSVGWAVGHNSTLLKTQDGGITWIKQKIPGNYQMSDLSFVDENSGWVIGSSKIFHTSDGGDTWIAQQSGTQYNLFGVHAVNPSTAWIIAPNGLVLKTTNGGDAWVQVNVGSSSFLTDIYFTDSNNGWIVGGSKTILHTSNGGVTWIAQTADVVTNNGIIDQIQFVDSSVGWIKAGYDYFKTTNGGATWSQLPTSPGSNTGFPPRFFMKNSTEGVMVGEWGSIQRTSDGASTWAGTNSLPRTRLDDVHFIDNNTGFVVGMNGLFLNTTDGGNNWNSRKIAVEGYINDAKVFFANATHGWVINRQNNILLTTDGGATWNRHIIGSSSFRGNSVHFVNATTGWVAGSQGNIFKTTDGGISWVPQSSGTAQDLQNLFFLNVNQGWAVGNSGTILATSNGGATWISNATPTTSSFITVHFTSDLEGWASTWDSDGLYHTKDGGSTWTKVILDTADNQYSNYIKRIQFVSPMAGFAHTHKSLYI
ncbi:MAG: hypothetical protein KKG00_06440, partial [Bacteroidetes bacterium]|nr:hypothetical protein [Bacteroidota bacterium]